MERATQDVLKAKKKEKDFPEEYLIEALVCGKRRYRQHESYCLHCSVMLYLDERKEIFDKIND